MEQVLMRRPNPIRTEGLHAAPKRVAQVSIPDLNFGDRLAALASGSDKRKGERTRNRLKAAAAQLLDTTGYRDLRVSDINETAGVSNALFYVYFKSKQEITQEVLTEFVETLVPEAPSSASRPSSIAEAIYRGNLRYTRVFAANPGLMRCLIQFGDEIPEFGKLWSDWNDRWHGRTLRAISRRDGFDGAPASEVIASVSALGMMVDGWLRLLYVERNPTVLEAAREIGTEPCKIALFLTRLWYRALTGKEMEWTPPLDGDEL